MFEHFTDRARKTMSLARVECVKNNHEFIGTEHILLGMIHEGSGVGCKVLKLLGIRFEAIVEEVGKVAPPSSVPNQSTGQVPFSPRSKRVIELAGESASQFGHPNIGTEHLLCGLMKENEGIAAQVLNNFGVKLEQIKDALVKLEVIDGSHGLPPKQMSFDVTVKFRSKKSFHKKVTYRIDALSREEAAMLIGITYHKELEGQAWELVEIVEVTQEALALK